MYSSVLNELSNNIQKLTSSDKTPAHHFRSFWTWSPKRILIFFRSSFSSLSKDKCCETNVATEASITHFSRTVRRGYTGWNLHLRLPVLPLYLRNHNIFSYVEMMLCNFSSVWQKRKELESVQGRWVCTHLHRTQTNITPPLVVLPPRSISICQCDTAEDPGRRVMAEGETRAETFTASNLNTVWRSGNETKKKTLRRQREGEWKQLEELKWVKIKAKAAEIL